MTTIHALNEAPEYAEICAVWYHGRWGVQQAGKTLADAVKHFQPNPSNVLPQTFVAVKDGIPVAMASLDVKDGNNTWPQHSPYVTTVFTHYKHRGHGIARALIARVEQAAKQLGHNQVYLTSGSAADYYPKLGYKKLETVSSATTASCDLTLFTKQLEN